MVANVLLAILNDSKGALSVHRTGASLSYVYSCEYFSFSLGICTSWDTETINHGHITTQIEYWVCCISSTRRQQQKTHYKSCNWVILIFLVSFLHIKHSGVLGLAVLKPITIPRNKNTRCQAKLHFVFPLEVFLNADVSLVHWTIETYILLSYWPLVFAILFSNHNQRKWKRLPWLHWIASSNDCIILHHVLHMEYSKQRHFLDKWLT